MATVGPLLGGGDGGGADADVTVFDPARKWAVRASEFASKGRNTPYGGRTLHGRVGCTLVDGRVVYQRMG